MEEKYIKELESHLTTESRKRTTKKIFIIILILIVGSAAFSFFYFVLPQIDFSDVFSGDDKTPTSQNGTSTGNGAGTFNASGDIYCNELWNCSEWSECYNFTQNRTCNDLNNCTSPIKKPPTLRECCSWTCVSWSECFPDNVQTRQCFPDNKSCKFEINIKPLTSQFCNFSNPCVDDEVNISYTERGTITDKNNIIWKDVCENNSLLVEYSCDDEGNMITEKYACRDDTPFCQLGKCVDNLTISTF
jgi:hypothetical protein